MDNDLALKIYIKARATPKVVAAFAERREFDKILIYSKQVGVTLFAVVCRRCCTPHFKSNSHEMCSELMQVGYSPDYLFLLQTILRSDPQVL